MDRPGKQFTADELAALSPSQRAAVDCGFRFAEDWEYEDDEPVTILPGAVRPPERDDRAKGG